MIDKLHDWLDYKNNAIKALVILWSILLLLFIVSIIGACSTVVDPAEPTITPNYTTDPPETVVVPTPTTVLVQVPLFQPRRYIDYQAEVVCYYTPSFDISCIPGSQTKIFTYR